MEPIHPYGVVYCITNTANGMVYIGQTTQELAARWKRHRTGGKDCRHLWNAIVKYGAEAFTIKEIATARTRQELDELEIAVIELTDSRNRSKGYNLASGGGGAKHADESKAKISRALKGRPLSDECKRRISQAKTGKPLSQEHRAKVSAAKTGKPHSEEAKKKMSLASMGKTMPAATDQHRLRLSLAAKAQWERRRIAAAQTN